MNPVNNSFYSKSSVILRWCIIKGIGKRGHIVANTLLLMMSLKLRKLGNICCGHKMFLNKIRNLFCVPDTNFLSATNVARAGKRGNICVGKLPPESNSILSNKVT